MCCSTPLHAQDQTVTASPKREFRAVWLSAVGVDWPNNKVTTTGSTTQIDKQKDELIGYLNNLVASNINAVCYHVRPSADAFYASSYEPWSHYLTGTRGKSPGYDPLAFAIEEAHKRGIELHAWVNPFRHMASAVSTTVAGVENDPIANNHSDWLLHYSNGSYSGTWLDPGNPDVRTHVLNVITEIVTKYDIDGVVFDDYFYPYGGTDDEDAASKAEYKPAGQDDGDWRRENIDKALKSVYDMLQAKKPWVRFGVAPFGIWTVDGNAAKKHGVTLPSGISGNDTYHSLACNTVSWMEGGYVDYISPQLYWPTTQTAQSYTVLCEWWSDLAETYTNKLAGGQKIHFFSSMRMGLRNNVPGTEQSTEELCQQVNLNRSSNKQDAPGSIFFSYKSGFVDRKVIPEIKDMYFTSQSLPPAMDWKAVETLGKPTNVKLNNTTLSWSHADAERFTVYVYGENEDDATAMANPANLVRVVYSTKDANGKKTNAIAVSELGNLQGKKVAVCAYDRYGNEYAAAYYPREEVPTITANKERVDLFAKVGDNTLPAVDVMVTGDCLTGNLTVKVNEKLLFNQIDLGHATITKVNNWDDKTGGTLRVAITSTAAKASAEGTITISSPNATSCKIPFTAIVDVATPQILVDKSEINLGAVEVNATTRPSADILVSGIDLVQEIAVSSSSAFTITEQAGWDKSKGGKLNIALKSAGTAGVYRETIRLSSNGATNVYIVVEATVKSEASVSNVPVGPLKGTVEFNSTPLWTTNFVTVDKHRSMSIYDGTLYLSSNDNTYYTVDRETGALTSHTVTGLSGKFYGNNLRMTDDGYMLMGNSGAGSSSITAFLVTEGQAESLTPSVTITKRTDYFQVYGSWNTPGKSGYILAVEQENNKLIKIPFSEGKLGKPSSIVHENLSCLGATNKVYPIDNEYFYRSLGEHSITKNKLSDATALPGEIRIDVDVNHQLNTSGLAVFTIHGHTYMVAPTDRKAGFQIFEITNGLAKNLPDGKTMTGAAIGSSDSGVGVEFCTHQEGNDVYIYALNPKSGLRAYKFTFTPENVAPTAGIVVRKDQEDLEESAAVGLTALQGARPKPYVDVEVKGVELSEDMTIACENPAITWECCAGWDKKTGGWLRITLDTDWAVGTYTEGITITSGSMSRTINVNATINAGAQPKTDRVQGAHTLENLWVYTEDITSDCRSMAYYDNKLYIPNSSSEKFITLDTSDENVKYLSATSFGMNGYERYNLRVTTDGQLLGGNNARGEGLEGEEIYQHDVDVYAIDKGNGDTKYLGEYQLEGRSDFFYTYGSWQTGGYILALSNGYYTQQSTTIYVEAKNKQRSVCKIYFSGGVLSSSSQLIENKELPSGASAKAIPAPNDQSFYATVESTKSYYYPTQHDWSGEELLTFQEVLEEGESPKAFTKSHTSWNGWNYVSGLGVFDLHSRSYMLLPANGYGKFYLFDITAGLNEAKWLFTAEPWNTTTKIEPEPKPNDAVTIDFCVHVEGDDAYIYMLAPGNGVAAYKFTPSYIFEGSGDVNVESNYSWHNPANWSTGMLPDENSNVLILTDCKISDGAGYAKKINIVKGNTLTIAPTGKLTVQEDIQQVANAFATKRSELIGAPDDAALRIEADATGQGVLVYFSPTQTYATVELYGARGVTPSLTGNKDYHIPWEYVAMPFAIQNAENTDFRGSWITAWEVPNDVDYPDQELEAGKAQWVFKEDNDVHLEPWKGYALIQMSPKKYTYGMQGLLQPPGKQTVTLKPHATTGANAASTGANFIGNSWTAPLKMAKLINTTDAIYLHKNQLSAEGYGEAYDAFTSANVEDEVINPLQGFFVKADKETTVTWDYATLVANGRQPVQNSYRKPAREMEATMSEQLEISVTANNGFYTKVLLCASDAYTTGFDTGYDAHKMLDSKSIPYLAAASGAGDMAILATPDLHGTYLNFSRGSGRSYTLRFSYTGAERLYLVDAVTGTSTAIRSGGSYSFTPTANDGYRFRISRKTLEEGALDGLELWAYGRQLYFTNTFGLPTDIWVYGVDGRLVEHRVTQDSQYRLSVPTTGVYVVRVNNEEGTQTMQVIL